MCEHHPSRREGALLKVALVGPEIEENLALRYLAAALEKADVRTLIVPFNAEDDFAAVLATILEEDPAIAALSLAFQWRAPDFLALAVALRERGYRGHITAGGHFATFAWRELLDDFGELDSICCYEAEETIVELAARVGSRVDPAGVPGLAVRDEAAGPVLRPRPQRQEISTLAWPDRRGEASSCLGHPVAALVSGRGCYASCAFCCIAAFHGQAGAARSVRLRTAPDLAAEMLWLKHRHGTEIFIFHDDTFFLPREADNLERIEEIASLLERGGMGRFATVIKARPPEVRPAVMQATRDRLGLIRVFLGVESASAQGLRTLRRGVAERQVHEALRVLAELGIYLCFNLLVFDPDATRESLEENLRFMEEQAEHPFNFGRVELYAGTPLLERLQREGRCRGDYLGREYDLSTADMQSVFSLAMRCFYDRNFAAGALANRLMGTRFDVEVARHFHPDEYRPDWLQRSKELSRRLARDSVRGLREILAAVADGRHLGLAGALRAARLARELRAVEAEVREAATRLEEEIQTAVGRRCRHVRRLDPRLGAVVR